MSNFDEDEEWEEDDDNSQLGRQEDKMSERTSDKYTASDSDSWGTGSRDLKADALEANQEPPSTSMCVASEPGEDDDEVKELFYNTIVENGPHGLGIVDAIQLAVILDDMSDQLDIIGQSIDCPQVDLRTKSSVTNDIVEHRPKFFNPPAIDPYSTLLFKDRYYLRQHYGTVASRRIEQMCQLSRGQRFRKSLDTCLAMFNVSRYTDKGKIQAERTRLNIIVDDLITELVQSLTFQNLVKSIDVEKDGYEGMKWQISKSLEDRRRIVDTKKALKRTWVEKKSALKEKDIAIWRIEDATQEMVRRKALESLYITKNGAMAKARMKKMCLKAETEVTDTREDLKQHSYDCDSAHVSMMDMLQQKLLDAQKRLEYWIDKYEVEKEALQIDLDVLKANRARDLERIRWLKFMIRDYSQIVMDERRIKAIEAERVRTHELQVRRATRLQAWWRGEMVRKKLGPFRPPKGVRVSEKGDEKNEKKKKKK